MFRNSIETGTSSGLCHRAEGIKIEILLAHAQLCYTLIKFELFQAKLICLLSKIFQSWFYAGAGGNKTKFSRARAWACGWNIKKWFFLLVQRMVLLASNQEKYWCCFIWRHDSKAYEEKNVKNM